MLYIGSDHGGFRLKERIGQFLREKEVLISDVGAEKYEARDDYVDFAVKLAEGVAREAASGILICRSGVGMAIVANKVKGVRAGFCFCSKQARLAVEDSNINVLCLSADLVSEEDNIKIVRTFVNSTFVAEERHVRRINKIKKYESDK